jgi:hypothetical protein
VTKEETEELVPIYDEIIETRKFLGTDKGARSLGKRTKGIREFAIRTLIGILSPRSLTLYEIANFGCDDFGKYPRPSTRIIHGVYGGKPLVGVEIGTGLGENALSLLRELNVERLYCIDPFVPYRDGDVKIQTAYSSESRHTLMMLSKFENVTFIRKFSSEAYREIPKSIDFVYIDGNHDYDYVLADLRNYYPLVHERGIVAGHDMCFPDVRNALADFCRENAIRPSVVQPDWVIIK